jgi:hypothetical protein
MCLFLLLFSNKLLILSRHEVLNEAELRPSFRPIKTSKLIFFGSHNEWFTWLLILFDQSRPYQVFIGYASLCSGESERDCISAGALTLKLEWVWSKCFQSVRIYTLLLKLRSVYIVSNVGPRPLMGVISMNVGKRLKILVNSKCSSFWCRFAGDLSVDLGLQIIGLCPNWVVLNSKRGVILFACWASGSVQNNSFIHVNA